MNDSKANGAIEVAAGRGGIAARNLHVSSFDLGRIAELKFGLRSLNSLLAIGCLLILCVIVLSCSSAAVAQSLDVAGKSSDDQAGTAMTAQQLLKQQAVLAGQFSELEDKLFELYQMERDSRPQRADLLRQMFELAKANNTSQRLQTIVQQIETGQLRLAQQAQAEALNDLKLLMEILQKEDENQRLQDLKRQQQENLRQVKRLLQLQNRLRDQAAQSTDPASLSESEGDLADQTQGLQGKVKQMENGGAEDTSQDSSADNSKQPSDAQESDSNGGSSGNSQSSDSADDSGNYSDGPAGQASESESQDSQQESQESELSKRLQNAQDRMRAAKKQLEESKGDQAGQEMQQAIEQLEAAKKELESILKQAREEEMMSTLARLEDQFRKMMEDQLRINQKTSQLEQVPQETRGTDHEITSAKLAGDQKKNAMAAMRATMLLRDDSTSIALVVTVEQLTEDMNLVGDRLLVANTDQLTQQIQQEIVESLELLIDSVVQAQEDVQKQASQSQQQSSSSSDPGEMPLVDQIAELKMLKGLQQRILRRHKMIAEEFQTAGSALGTVQDESAQIMLQKLQQQQNRLFEMTRKMVQQIK